MLDHLRNSQLSQEEEISKQDPWEWTRMKLENGASSNFWRDPDVKFCIREDDEDKYVELMCPYNYLSPASYVPCRARLVVCFVYIKSPPDMIRLAQGVASSCGVSSV